MKQHLYYVMRFSYVRPQEPDRILYSYPIVYGIDPTEDATISLGQAQCEVLAIAAAFCRSFNYKYMDYQITIATDLEAKKCLRYESEKHKLSRLSK